VIILITEVFEKATLQHCFVEMYATLCVQLSSWFSDHVKVGNFKRILLDQCQASFEANLHPPEDTSSKTGPTLTEGEQLEQQVKYKTRMLGNIRLVGQLLVKNMVASKVLIACGQQLLEGGTAATLEPLAMFLSIVGGQFDVPDWKYHSALRDILSQVMKLVKDKKLPARTRFLLQDVMDLREAGWVDKKVATKKMEAPKKLAEISKT